MTFRRRDGAEMRLPDHSSARFQQHITRERPSGLEVRDFVGAKTLDDTRTSASAATGAPVSMRAVTGGRGTLPPEY